jgi:succinoglycan biosynthesis transport protein ExoP
MSIPKSNLSLEGKGPADSGASFGTGTKSRPGLFKRTPRDFLDMFLERWWLGAIAGGIAAALIIIFRPHFEPLYRTEVSLLFETRKAAVVNMVDVVDTTLQNATELATHMEQLRSNTFANYVLSSFTPEETKLIQKPYIDPLHPEAPVPQLNDIIRPGVVVWPRKNTPIIGISVTNRSPEAAALIANRYAQKYIDYKLDNAATLTTSAIMFLRNQAEELRSQVELAQAQLQDYRAKNNLAALGESQNIVLQRLQSLGNVLVKADVDQIDAKNLIDKVDEYKKTGRNLLEIPQILGSGMVDSFARQLKDLASQQKLLAEDYDVEHPKIKQIELQIVEAQRRLDDAIDKAIADLRSRFEVADQYVQRVRAEMLSAQAEARKLDKISTEYKLLETEANEKSRALASITSRLTEAKITSQMANTNIAIFDPAWIPGAPADTGIAAVTMKASAAGFGLLLFIPFMLGFFDTRIRTPIHVEEGLQEPLLGAVKRMRKMGETQRAQVFRLQKEKDLAEAYLGIFSEVEVRSSLGFPKTLLITSSVPAEGKSLLCSNLAAVFASHKRRTLLVDCDLRRPTLHRYFGVKVDTGWVQWLEAPAAARPATPLGIVAVSDELHLLPAGRTPNNPTELLDRLSRRETLQPLLQNYDIVIFDTPPAAVFPDALLLARSCHEMIYVCRYRTVRLAVVRKVLERFRDSGISMLGIVLNQLPEAKARSYGYHGYGTQSAEYYKAYAEKPEA